ncbi:MAG: hypothetical protein Q8L88_00600 [Bacteroidota bacterium]|nr:hypothetical protein [Bacteroidota bacterium]
MAKKKDNESEKIQFKREMITLAVEAAIEKRNFKKLSEIVELADEYGAKKSLRFKGWMETGLYYQREGHHTDAIIALSSARVLQLTNHKILSALFLSFNEFVSEFRDKFSTEDLNSMLETIQNLLEFYKSKGMWTTPSIEQGKQIFRRISSIKFDATSAVETPASHKVERIVKALRQNVTMEEVTAEYARIMAPVFLDLIAKEIDEERDKKKKKEKKKTPDDETESSDKEKKE